MYKQINNLTSLSLNKPLHTFLAFLKISAVFVFLITVLGESIKQFHHLCTFDKFCYSCEHVLSLKYSVELEILSLHPSPRSVQGPIFFKGKSSVDVCDNYVISWAPLFRFYVCRWFLWVLCTQDLYPQTISTQRKQEAFFCCWGSVSNGSK